MSRLNKDVFPQVPENFHNRVINTLEDLECTEKKSKLVMSKTLRTVLVAAAIIVLATLSTFAGNKVYQSWITKTDKQVNLTPETQEVKMQYVQIKLNYLTEGLKEDELGKYSFGDMKGGLSLCLYRLDENSEIKLRNAENYSERMFGKNKGAIITKSDNFDFNRELVIYFKDEGYMFTSYIGRDVSDEELEKIANGVELVETDAEHAYPLDIYKEPEVRPYIEQSFKSQDIININEPLKNFPATGEKDKFEPVLDVTVENVEWRDNVNGLKKSDFDEYIFENENVFDGNGTILPYERTENDGSKVQTNRKFLYLTLKVKNTDSVSRTFLATCFNLIIATKQDDKYIVARDVYSTLSKDRRAIYIDGNKGSVNFYRAIRANGEITVHVGYLVDTDRTENLYLSARDAGVFSYISIPSDK